MKKALKIVCTILYVLGIVFTAMNMQLVCTRDPMLCIALSLLFFVVHLFAWLAPKTLFNFVWKKSAIYSDSWDYETSYSKLDICGLGFAITAVIFLVLGIFIAVF